MAYVTHDRTFWENEAAYILRVDPDAPGADMNRSKATFRGYCEMQANHAEANGFPDIATRIREHVGL